MSRWRHRAVSDRGAPSECRVCAAPIEVGVDATGRAYVRHDGETFRRLTPSPEDAESFDRALDVVEAALRSLPDGASDDDRARASVEAIMLDGRLRRRRGPSRYVAADPVEAVPDRYEVTAARR
jgi:hypothetical protein